MRVTAEAKDATRQRIVDAALRLFKANGFEATTTREIAAAAEIATGTLFNYFANKEAIVASVAEESLAKAHARLEQRQSATALEEALFALVAAELRQLTPLRKFIVPLLETALSPLSTARTASNDALRADHLEIVAGLARERGLGELSSLALQVYWTLYTGVLAFWAVDKSPKQEDTLALLDESLGMFVSWLQSGVR